MGLLDWLFGQGDAGADEALLADTEHLVDAMDSRLRLVDGYQRKLLPAVSKARQSLETMVAALPGPLDFSQAGWSTDPLVKALFASPREMQRRFSAEPVIRQFFEAPENVHAEAVCVAIFASLETRRALGFALQGDVVQADVIREMVSFTAHRMTRPAVDAAGVRAGLMEAGMHYLANQALALLAESRTRRQVLEEERDLLRMRLDARSRHGHALESLLSATEPEEVEEGRLQALEQRLAALPLPPRTLEDQLALLEKVLENVPDYVHLEHRTLHLDSMNVLCEDGDGQAIPLSLCQLRADGRPLRTVVLGRFLRADLMPRESLHQGVLLP